MGKKKKLKRKWAQERRTQVKLVKTFASEKVRPSSSSLWNSSGSRRHLGRSQSAAGRWRVPCSTVQGGHGTLLDS